jgi:PAT family beta-lactamase induction signal transducer AmpG
VAGGIRRLLGGLWMVRLGINRALWLFGAGADGDHSRFRLAGVARRAAKHRRLRPGSAGGVIAAEYLGVGLGTAAFTAFIARATNPAFTATQFALFTSLAAVPRTFINASAGALVESLGWVSFFILCFVLAAPGMALLLKVAPWNEIPASPKT